MRANGCAAKERDDHGPERRADKPPLARG